MFEDDVNPYRFVDSRREPLEQLPRFNKCEIAVELLLKSHKVLIDIFPAQMIGKS